MKTYPTLYKKDSKGKIRIWYIEQDNDKYRVVAGLQNGKQVTNAWTTAQPTNVGRSNERDGVAQATFEVDAEYTKQKKRDYFESIGEITETGSKIFEVMLAQKYPEAVKKKKVSFPVFSQPKLDGIRCYITKDGMFTRNGERHVSCPHIWEAIEHVFEKYPDISVDGELYNHDFKEDFNSITSMVKKLKPKSEDLALTKAMVQYHVYDIYVPEGYIFSKRMAIVQRLVKDLNSPYIHSVKTDYVATSGELDKIYEDYLKDKYEGQMIRQDVPYENKRSWSLLKRKEFQDVEATLIGIDEGKGNWEGKARIGHFKLDNGIEFDADICGTMEFLLDVYKHREMYYNDKYTIIFQNYTPDGKPRFGKCKCLVPRWDI